MKVSNSFSILFYPKTSDLDKKGKVPLFVRITVGGKRSEVSLKRKIKPEKWCPISGKVRVKGSNPQLKELNRYLDEIKVRIYRIQSGFLTNGKPYTASMVKNKFLNRDEPLKTVVEIYDEHNTQIEQLVGLDYSYGGYRRHVRTRKHLAEFIKKDKQNDILSRKWIYILSPVLSII
jgi:hypothetical protein